MSDAKHDILIKLIALGMGIGALIWTAEGLESGGAFAKTGTVAAGIFAICTAVGFARTRGWAFLVVSIGLLVGFLTTFVSWVVSFDTGEGTMVKLLKLLTVIVLIAYLGRYDIERRFRPHLELEH